MIICPKCETANEEAATVCVNCGAALTAGERLHAEIDFADHGGAQIGGRQDQAPPDFKKPDANGGNEPPDEHRPNNDDIPALEDIWQTPDPYEPSQDDDRRKKAYRQYKARLEEVERSGAYTIGVVGFSSSGKTFFIERLKYEYSRCAEYGYFPRPKPHDPKVDLQGTDEIVAHRFDAWTPEGNSLSGRRSESFYIVDIPGERFKAAAQKQGEGPESESLIKVLKLSDALIVVLATDEVLTPPRSRKERAADVDLPSEIAAMEAIPEADRKPGTRRDLAAARNRLEINERASASRDKVSALVLAIGQFAELARKPERDSGQARQAVFTRSNEEAAREGKKIRGKVPVTFFAIAKADLAINPDRDSKEKKAKKNPTTVAYNYPQVADSDLLDVDPAVLLKLNNPELFNQITDCFGIHKIDFITCFENQRSDDLKPNYDRMAYGITDVVSWIKWAREHSRKLRRRTSLDGAEPNAPRLQRLVQFTLHAVEGVRLAWLRFETGRAGWIARSVRKVDNQPLEKLGLKPLPIYKGRAGVIGGNWLGGLLKSLMDSPYLRPWATFAGLTLGALLVVVFLAWPWSGDPDETYGFRPENIYPAEIARMEREIPEFATGLVDRSGNSLKFIPSTGGYFSIADYAARTGLNQFFRDLDAASPGGVIARSDAPGFQQRLGNLPQGDRTISSLAKGLVELRSGQFDLAKSTLGESLANLEKSVKQDPPGDAAQERRVKAMQIALNNALGVAELETAQPVDAPSLSGSGIMGLFAAKAPASSIAPALSVATGNLENTELRVAAAGNIGNLLFDVKTSADERWNMLLLDSGMVYTNRLAELIRLHSAALDRGETGEPERRAMAALAIRLNRELDMPSENSRPLLQANVQIAAARSGAFAEIAPAGEEVLAMPPESQPVSQAAETVPRIISLNNLMRDPAATGVDQNPADRDGYWSTIANFRTTLAEGRATRKSVAESVAAIANESTRRDAVAWLRDAVGAEFSRENADKGKIARVYGEYLTGSHYRDQWEARTILGVGLTLAIGLGVLFLVVLLLALVRFRSLRESYRQLHEPRHRIDRLLKNSEA